MRNHQAVRFCRRKKSYDDDLLVELIVRGNLSNAAIARQVGISDRQVGRIVTGRSRQDLQPRLDAAIRGYLDEARRLGKRLARGSDGPSAAPQDAPGQALAELRRPRAPRGKLYDDDLLVELIACGRGSQARIARRVGVSASTVSRIAAGLAREDLQPRIGEARRVHRTGSQRMVVWKLKELLRSHLRAGLSGRDELARKCREFLIDKVWDGPADTRPGETPAEPKKAAGCRCGGASIAAAGRARAKQQMA